MQIQQPFSYHIALHILLLFHFFGTRFLGWWWCQLSSFQFLKSFKYNKVKKEQQTRYSTSKSEFCIYVESADHKSISEQVGDLCYGVARTRKIK